MKPWIALAAQLYPATWRKRYGSEFQALLDDVNPGWRELFDVLKGALKMQLSTGATYLKLGAAFAIAGVLVATVASFVIPKEYTSTAVLRLTSVERLSRAQQKALSRTSLAQIIQQPNLQLYPSERASQPLEDIIENMRARNVQMSVLNNKDHSAAISISFRYPDKQKAQGVVNALITKLVEGMAERSDAGSDAGPTTQNLEILDPPSLPKFPTSPKRPKMLITGLIGGLLIGLVSAVFIRHPRRSLVFASLGLVGCLLGGASSLLIPNRYISSAVIRVVPYDHNFEQALNRLGRPGLRVQVIHLASSPGAAAVHIQFEDADPRKAQAAVASVTASLIAETQLSQKNIEYLDTPNYPASPAYPNRLVISLLGFGVGLIAATATLLLQNRRRLKHAATVG